MARLEVHVVSPERELFAGEAEMVVARGTEGDVGVLAGHAPMLVELRVHPVRVVLGGGNERTFLVDGGFLHVSTEGADSRVDILADDAQLPEEVDAAEARRRAEELRRRVEEENDAEAEAELAKALMRAEHAG